jgi:adenosylcobinamide-GDP ribazoletransferase
VRSALSFLTIIPVGGAHRAPGRFALVCFPVVGLVVGCGWAACGWAFGRVFDSVAAAACVMCFDLLVTGGLHADAVADASDGLASRRAPPRALEVMRDPGIGAVGAAALVVWLLMRFGWTQFLISKDSALALIGAPVVGRTAMVVVLGLSDSPPNSLAWQLGQKATRGTVVLATAIGVCVCALAGLVVWGPFGLALCVGVAASALASALGFKQLWKRRFKIFTGDAAGSIASAAELVVLAGLALVATL